MKIAHLSDIHIPSNHDIVYGVYPEFNLEKAIIVLNSIENLECVIISGDISNDGKLQSYLKADALLSKLTCPIYCTLGNHDNKQLIKDLISSAQLKSMKFLDDVIIENFRFVFLNSIIEITPGENKSKGFINISQLRDLLSIADAAQKHILVIHHPSIELGGWIDDRILINRNEFNSFIKDNKNIVAVLSGHNHFHYSKVIESCFYNMGPSVSTTFCPTAKKFEEMYQPAFDILTLNEAEIKSETIYL